MSRFQEYVHIEFLKWRQRPRYKRLERILPSMMGGLAQLLEAGLPLQLALQHLYEAASRPLEKKHVDKARVALQMGETLSTAWSADIPNLLSILLAAGERSGKIPLALRAWENYVFERRRWGKKIGKALAYPCMVSMMSGFLMIFVLTGVLPSLRSMYVQLNLGTSLEIEALVNQLFMLIKMIVITPLVMVILVFLLYLFRHRYPRLWTALYSNLPGVQLLKLYRTNLISLLLYLLIDAGIPLTDALQILAAESGNGWRSRAFYEIHTRILNGQSLSECFVGDWDGILQVFIGWAEQTGDIAHAFYEIERRTKERFQERTERLMSYVEPILVLVMGSIVAGTMLLVFLPMYDLISSISSSHISNS